VAEATLESHDTSTDYQKDLLLKTTSASEDLSGAPLPRYDVESGASDGKSRASALKSQALDDASELESTLSGSESSSSLAPRIDARQQTAPQPSKLILAEARWQSEPPEESRVESEVSTQSRWQSEPPSNSSNLPVESMQLNELPGDIRQEPQGARWYSVPPVNEGQQTEPPLKLSKPPPDDRELSEPQSDGRELGEPPTDDRDLSEPPPDDRDLSGPPN
jgi:hypothetical protein